MSSVQSGMEAGSASGGAKPLEPAASTLLDRREAGRRALRGSILRAGAYVAGILLSLVSARVLIGHLGVSEFGRYVTVLALMTIVAGFTEGGLNSVVLREFATLAGRERREMIRSALGMRLVLTAVGVALAVGFAAAAGYETVLILGVGVAGAGLVIQLAQSTLATVLQAELRFGWVAAAEIARQMVNVAAIVALVLAGTGLLPLLAAGIPAAAASLLLTGPLVRHRVSLMPSIHMQRWWGLLRETIPWAVLAAVNIVYFRVSIVLMSIIASAVATGYFATSFRITEILVGVPGLLVSAAFPILARAEYRDVARFRVASARLFELSLLAGTWMVICLEVGAGFAIHLIAGNKADPSIAVLRIQGLALIATFVAVGCGYPLLTLRRYRTALVMNLGALVLSGGLTLGLVPELGARGAAIAAVIAETGLAVGVTAALALADREIRLRFSTLGVSLLAGGLGALAGFLTPVHPLLGVLVASAVFLGTLALLGRFPHEVREVLAGSLRSVMHWHNSP
jgi:O-antigen/teichoic acid export membrane protein